MTLNQADQNIIVQAVARVLLEQYVFPDKASALAQHLQAWWANAPVLPEDTQGFCQSITATIRAHTPDLHLSVFPSHYSQIPSTPQGNSLDLQGLRRVEILADNIGLLEIRSFDEVESAARGLGAAMEIVSQTKALVIDLRQNPGGHPLTTAFLIGFFFDQPFHVSTFYSRHFDAMQTWTPSYLPAPRYLERPVVVLTSAVTGSGAEELAYVLSHANRATLVGETTAGAANPGGFFKVHPLVDMFVATGRPVTPSTGSNWEGLGVEPHIKTRADKALEAALTFLKEKIATP